MALELVLQGIHTSGLIYARMGCSIRAISAPCFWGLLRAQNCQHLQTFDATLAAGIAGHLEEVDALSQRRLTCL